jgi:DNA-binding NarL/FixJ family response regulator
MIKIIIADDHEIVRAGLKQIIADHPNMQVTGEASNGNELLKKIREHEYDVILLDIHMPGRNGLETLKQIKEEKKDIPVLVLTMYPEDKYAIRSLKAGAAGYLTKVTISEELVGAIKKVYQGGKYISLSLAETLADAISCDSEKLPHDYLSDREFQVLCMIASGKTIGKISEELCLSVKTISTYRKRILEKMNLKNNAELTHYGIKNRLVNIGMTASL